MRNSKRNRQHKKIPWFKRIDTSKARQSLSKDFTAASKRFLTLFLLSVPVTDVGLANVIASAFGVAQNTFAMSPTTAMLFLAGALVLRVLAFVLECEVEKD